MKQTQHTSEKTPEIQQPEKKAYTAPQLIRQGKVEELTQEIANPSPSDPI